MIKKVVSKHKLKDSSLAKRDLYYWLTKSVSERIAAVEELRRQFYGNTGRLRTVACVVQRRKS
jgi:hypothetical protein